MSILTVDLELKQGATFRQEFRYMDGNKVPYDLTGFTARMQIRTGAGLLACDLSTSNGGITLSSTGDINLYISDEQTAAMSFPSAKYDLFLMYPNGDADCILDGKVTLEKAQTRNG